MKNIRQQQGLTMISWLVILSAIGFAVFLTMKILPVYISGFNSYSSLESMTKEPGLSNKSLSEIKEMLWRRMDINMVTDIHKDDIYVTKGKRDIKIEIDYEVRKNIISNLDVIARFNKAVTIPTSNASY